MNYNFFETFAACASAGDDGKTPFYPFSANAGFRQWECCLPYKRTLRCSSSVPRGFLLHRYPCFRYPLLCRFGLTPQEHWERRGYFWLPLRRKFHASGKETFLAFRTGKGQKPENTFLSSRVVLFLRYSLLAGCNSYCCTPQGDERHLANNQTLHPARGHPEK